MKYTFSEDEFKVIEEVVRKSMDVILSAYSISLKKGFNSIYEKLDELDDRVEELENIIHPSEEDTIN